MESIDLDIIVSKQHSVVYLGLPIWRFRNVGVTNGKSKKLFWKELQPAECSSTIPINPCTQAECIGICKQFVGAKFINAFCKNKTWCICSS
ncbi:hypothetical protein Lal_00020878 [Lupinus albus]|nr:hypothetical protein Lal_00020878 [Lupinus albus]